MSELSERLRQINFRLADKAAAEIEQLEAENAKLRKDNHALRGLVDVVLDADECNGFDTRMTERRLRLPKAWMAEARKVVGDE